MARETRGWRRGVRRKAVRERDGLAVVGTRATKRALPTREHGRRSRSVRANETVREAVRIAHAARVCMGERMSERANERACSVGRSSDTSTCAS